MLTGKYTVRTIEDLAVYVPAFVNDVRVLESSPDLIEVLTDVVATLRGNAYNILLGQDDFGSPSIRYS